MADKEKSDKKQRRESSASQPQRTNAVVRYFRETRGEMRKVVWPTREESLRLSGIVLGVTFAFAVFLGVLDALFSRLFQWLIEILA